MKFVVLIACRSGSPTLEDTLRSLAAAEKPGELEKILVIENSGSSLLSETVMTFGKQMPVDYLHTPQKGKSVALNLAITERIPDDRFILFTDDDVRVNKNWLTKYASAFSRYGKGHYFGGGIGVDYEEKPDPVLIDWFPYSAKGFGDELFDHAKDIKFLGSNWASHKSDLEEAGFFDRSFGIGSKVNSLGEETLIQLELDKMGVQKILIPDNFVWHKVPKERSSWKWLKDRYVRFGKTAYQREENRIKWLRKNIKFVFMALWSVITNRKRENIYRFVLHLKKVEGFLIAAIIHKKK